MNRPTPPRSAGRPRDQAKARAILEAGWSLFLERGVEATTVEAIAARAGVSKVTLYSHYSDRTALFRAAVLMEMERIEQAQGLHAMDQATPIADQLRVFGTGIMAFLASKTAIDFYSVIAGELRRHEALARDFYDLGPGRTRANLAALLDAGMRRGELIALDPSVAAEDLFGLWQGLTNFQFALGIDVAAIRDDLDRRVRRGVDLFMHVYGATTARHAV